MHKSCIISKQISGLVVSSTMFFDQSLIIEYFLSSTISPVIAYNSQRLTISLISQNWNLANGGKN
jgi:hypothetical protein